MAVEMRGRKRLFRRYIRALIFLDAPFDRFAAGDAKAMSPAAQRGRSRESAASSRRTSKKG